MFAAPVLAGILLGLTAWGGHSTYAFHFAVFVGFVPLWRTWLRVPRLGGVLLTGWLCQFCLGLVAHPWVAYTVNEFSHVGPALSAGALLLYGALMNLYIPLAGALWHLLFRGRGLPLWAEALALAWLTALAEALVPRLFPWNLGYAWLYLGFPGAQIADVIGFRGLSALTFTLNGLFLLASLTPRRMPALLAAAALFAGVNLAGLERLRALPPPDRVARVLVVQPGLTNREIERRGRSDAENRALLDRLFRLTENGLAAAETKPDFVLWPENAFPDFIVEPNLELRLGPLLKKFVREHKISLVTGGFGVTGAPPEIKIVNGLFAIGPEGTWASPPYQKSLLIPFGEYIPGETLFPALRRWFPDVRRYAPGTMGAPLSIAGLRLGGQVCYESLFDVVSRAAARSGAQLIVNVTNDSWYGPWIEPEQHLFISLARAVETRRPVVRGTNSGISAVALADGTRFPLSPLGEPWAQVFEVPYRAEPPVVPYLGWGFWVAYAGLAIGLGGLLPWVALRRHRRNP